MKKISSRLLKPLKNNHGFTLIELGIALAVAAALVALYFIFGREEKKKRNPWLIKYEDAVKDSEDTIKKLEAEGLKPDEDECKKLKENLTAIINAISGMSSSGEVFHNAIIEAEKNKEELEEYIKQNCE